MTAYYLRDKQTLLYRRRPWSTLPTSYASRHEAERYRVEGEEVVAMTDNAARALWEPKTDRSPA